MGTNENVVPLPARQPEMTQLDSATLPGRALIGWMHPNVAVAALGGGAAPTSDVVQRVGQARQAVAGRPTVDGPVDAVVSDDPALAPVVDRLRGHPATQGHFSGGWAVRLVDLSRVCAYQPQVLTEHAAERVSGAAADDLEALGAITLPTVDEFQLPIKLVDGTFLITSRDHNVMVRQPWVGQPAPGAPPVVGFEVIHQTSMMFVANYQGRYFLCDGNHRAVGFLSRGISRVPAFVRTVETYEDLNIPRQGMLPHDAFMGDRPPFLADYLDDEVAADVQVPASEKLILIQALQLAPPLSMGG